MSMYEITYAQGTSAHDERRYVRRNVSAEHLADTIRAYQRKGQRVVAVRLQS